MFSKSFVRVIPFAVLGLAMAATPAAAASPVIFNWSVASATAPVASCVGGGALPCSGGTVRVTYPTTQLTADSLPFSNYAFFKQPATLTGYLDIPTSTFDSNSGCYSGVTGTFQAHVARGGAKKQRLAFELIMHTNAYCNAGSNAHRVTAGTWTIDASSSEDQVFRGGTSSPATGTGTFTIDDNVDFTGVSPFGNLAANFQGSIAIP